MSKGRRHSCLLRRYSLLPLPLLVVLPARAANAAALASWAAGCCCCHSCDRWCPACCVCTAELALTVELNMSVPPLFLLCRLLRELSTSNPPAFMCHYYNHYFAHTGVGGWQWQRHWRGSWQWPVPAECCAGSGRLALRTANQVAPGLRAPPPRRCPAAPLRCSQSQSPNPCLPCSWRSHDWQEREQRCAGWVERRLLPVGGRRQGVWVGGAVGWVGGGWVGGCVTRWCCVVSGCRLARTGRQGSGSGSARDGSSTAALHHATPAPACLSGCPPACLPRPAPPCSPVWRLLAASSIYAVSHPPTHTHIILPALPCAACLRCRPTWRACAPPSTRWPPSGAARRRTRASRRPPTPSAGGGAWCS